MAQNFSEKNPIPEIDIFCPFIKFRNRTGLTKPEFLKVSNFQYAIFIFTFLHTCASIIYLNRSHLARGDFKEYQKVKLSYNVAYLPPITA